MQMDWSDIDLKDTLFMCFDLETTGINIATDRIVQIAVSYFHQGKIVQQHSQILNPQMPIPEGASAVHGVYDHHVIDQPTFAEFLPRLIPHFRGEIFKSFSPPVLLGYNLISYDIPLFKSELKRCGHPESLIDLPALDLIPFARWYLRNQKLKLTDLCKYFSVPLEQAHNALFDAKACGYLLPLFAQAGFLKKTVAETLAHQSELLVKTEEEYKRFKMWLYVDRFTNELTLGQGKYVGTPLADADPSYLDYCLRKMDGLPTEVERAFLKQLGRV